MNKKIALLSVYNKDGIIDFARFLKENNYAIYASRGTSAVLTEANIENDDIASLVGGDPILNHKVVTLSREIHAGLLADPNNETEVKEMKKLNIPFIDLVYVNLYPLEETLNIPNVDEAKVIEKTDIGGPTMLSSAAKGRRIVIGDPDDLELVKDWIRKGKPDREAFLRHLAAKADYIVAHYRLLSAQYHSNRLYDGMIGERVLTYKYGENPWQQPAYLYKEKGNKDPLAQHQLIYHTKIHSTINAIDVHRAIVTITHIAAGFEKNIGNGKNIFIGLAVKHGNACGGTIAFTAEQTIKNILDGNLKSVLGGVLVFAFPITEVEATLLVTYKVKTRRFIATVVAPSFTEEALSILTEDARCVLASLPSLKELGIKDLNYAPYRRILRGSWIQHPNFTAIIDLNHPELKKYGDIEKTPFEETQDIEDIVLAWGICATQNSNTIVLTKDGMLIGAGVGQKDRVEAAQLAIKIATDAKHIIEGAIALSDSFFPFDDAPKALIDAELR